MPTEVYVSGRTVWASGPSPLELGDKINQDTGQPVMKDGVKQQERGFGLAIPKMVNGQPNPEFAAWWQAANVEAAKQCNGVAPAWPNNRIFSYKLKDGDARLPPDIKRNLPERDPPEHTKNHWVIAIKSSLPNPPPIYDGSSGQWLQVDPNNIRGNKLKVGDFVGVKLSIDGHLGQSPGLYLNPNGLTFIGFGEAITRNADPTTMFGAAPGAVALPAGASATPVGPSIAPPAMPGPAAAPPAAPGMPGNGIAPGVAPPLAPPAAPATPPTPGIVSPGVSPPAPLAPPATGFAAGLPGMPAPVPAPASPPPPAAPPALRFAVTRYDAASGRPIGIDPATGLEAWADHA